MIEELVKRYWIALPNERKLLEIHTKALKNINAHYRIEFEGYDVKSENWRSLNIIVSVKRDSEKYKKVKRILFA